MKTKTQDSHALKLSARWTYPESESVGIMSDKKCFGDVSSWSRATVWFRRPDDVKQNRVSNPVRNLQALRESGESGSRQNQEQPKSVSVNVGIFTGTARRRGQWVAQVRQPDGQLAGGRFVPSGASPEGDAAHVIATAVGNRLAKYRSVSAPSKAEQAEVAYLRACKAKETKARLAFLAKAIKAKR